MGLSNSFKKGTPETTPLEENNIKSQIVDEKRNGIENSTHQEPDNLDTLKRLNPEINFDSAFYAAVDDYVTISREVDEINAGSRFFTDEPAIEGNYILAKVNPDGNSFAEDPYSKRINYYEDENGRSVYSQMDKDTYRERYDVENPLPNGVVGPREGVQKFVQFLDDTEIISPNGELLKIKAGDYLNISTLTTCSKNDFENRYTPFMELQNFLAEEFNNENSVIDFQSGIFEGIEYKGEHPSAGEIMEVLIKKLHPVDLFSLQNRVEVLQTLFNEYESYRHKESLNCTLVLEEDQFKFIFNNSNINLHGYEYTEKYNQNPEEEVYPYGITIAYKTTERGKNNSHYKIFEEVEFHGRIYGLKASRDAERNKPREVNENTDVQEELEQIADFIDKNKDYICINEGIFDEFRRGTPTLEEIRNTLKTKLSPDDLKKLQGLIGTPEENGALREFLDKSKQLVINNRDYYFFKLVLSETGLNFDFPMVFGYQKNELNYNNSDKLEKLLIPLNDKLVTRNSSFSSNVKKSI